MSWSGNRSTGGGIVTDTKVKVDGNDLTAQYLADKLVSTDGSVTFTVLNPLGVEQYDASIAPIPVTRADALALIAGNSLALGRIYLITDAYEIFATRVCQVFMQAVSVNTLNPLGYGTFTNENTAVAKNCLFDYDITNNVMRSVLFVDDSCRVINTGAYNFIDIVDFNTSTLTGSEFKNCTVNSSTPLTITNSVMTEVTWNFNDVNQLAIHSGDRAFRAIFNYNVADSNLTSDSSIYNQCTINIGRVEITVAGYSARIEYSQFENASIVTMQDGAWIKYTNVGQQANIDMSQFPQFVGSYMDNCNIKQGAIVVLVGNQLTNCKVGTGKTWITSDGSYNATNGSLEDLDSTFEVFIDPNVAGVMDMVDYKFAGIVRIGDAGVPATWNLKQINNFPTDHIFCIVPATSNTVDVYDAGAGGNNIYLNVAAVVTYDGTKDDTLVVRSGLNSYLKLFQIGGWQAPSA